MDEGDKFADGTSLDQWSNDGWCHSSRDQRNILLIFKLSTEFTVDVKNYLNIFK